MKRNISRCISLCALACGLLGLLSLDAPIMAREPSKADQELVAKVAAKYFEVATPVEGWAWPPLVGIAQSDEVNAFASMEKLKAGQKPVLKEYSDIVWIDVPASSRAVLPDKVAVAKDPSAGNAQAAPAAGVPSADAVPADIQPAGDVQRPQPYIILLQGFLDRIVKGREVYLAETFGHELSHVLLRHAENYGAGGAPLVAYAMTRQQESDADMLGMKLSLQANYPYDELIKAVKSWRDLDLSGSSFAALRSTHPGWTDRAALIDERQAELWSSISAFENGVYLLMAENYNIADRCFTQVVKEAPSCYEAWANRGYARLMRYCDALEPDDLREMALNHIVVGGFYYRALSLEERGVNVDLWYDAVGDLREALRLKDSLILPKANLALAYLVHPNHKELGKAAELFEQVTDALKQGALEEEISPLDRAALLVNAGVTEFANGDAKAGRQFFDRAQTIYLEEMKSPPAGPLESAMLYSQASQLAASPELAQRQQAVQRFEEYLSTTSPAVAWWNLAYDHYQELCQSQKLTAKSREELERPQTIHFRPVTSIVVADGKEIALNDPVSQVVELLGEGKKIPVVRRTNICRRKYDSLGLELLCTDRLIAVRLRQAKSPPLVLRGSGPGGKTTQVHVGMPLAELQHLLAGDESGWDKRYGAQYTVNYRYFYRLGFGVDVDEDGNIAEIILAQIPAEAKVR
ncbi:MAG TPA: M48 family metalloprotease [Pirellulales bacterium]|nr:M48 family metalloprotease [Pirellulales bacterium]